MSNQQIDALETRLWIAQSRLRKKHRPLKAQLQQLLEELNNTWRSSKKLEIMNKMSEIETQIKQDNDCVKRIQGEIENMKSRWRKEQWQTETFYYEAMASAYRLANGSVRLILQDLEETLD